MKGNRNMTNLIIKAGDFTFGARLEEEDAPKTCAMFRKLLPYTCLLYTSDAADD